MATIVKRSPADKPGNDIVDPLLTTIETQTERGRQEINRQSTDRDLIVGDKLTLLFVTPGFIATIADSNKTQIGKILSFSLSISMSDKELNYNSQISVEAVK